ncbi:MAG: 5-oxoprolinase subunit PxpA [Rheinheimera sp.]|nr:5-oxoprolinase subunit PxpA [Rheinheimera sp.]
MKYIDLNADLGEGCGDDLAIIPLLSSANISCGAHAGSEADILNALRACKQHQVCVGAHPSYPDRTNFGRQTMLMTAAELVSSLQQQLQYFQQLANKNGVVMAYVKPHGALYNQAAVDCDLAALIVEVIKAHRADLAVLTLPDCALFHAAKAAGIPVFQEAFADRAYLATGQLVPRSQPGAVLGHQAALQQSLRLVQTGIINSIEQQELQLTADSLCLHGDSPEALHLARDLSSTLKLAGVHIRSFLRGAA